MVEIGIGIMGFGTVGVGVAEAIKRHQHLIGHRTEVALQLRRVAEKDIDRQFDVEIDKSMLTVNAEELIDDPSVDIVVETIGGTTDAKRLILRALNACKPVVTANKALLAHYGKELFEAASRNNVDLQFEASVGGGIPVLAALRRGLVANHINRIYGIVNGTCNFILTEMEHRHKSFAEALSSAQAHGFAESDPTLDIEGIDTAHKAAILASLSYGYPVDMASVSVRGITGVELVDINTAAELGYCIKLLANIDYRQGQSEISVSPTLVPKDHLLAAVHGENNAVMIDGDVVGETMYYGKGAGRLPTASAVMADICEVAVNLANDVPSRLPSLVVHDHYGPPRAFEDVSVRYYLRMSLLDAPNVLSVVSGILGRYGISIASVLQKESSAGAKVPVIFLTQEAREANFEKALAEIDQLEEVGDKTIRYRIADL